MVKSHGRPLNYDEQRALEEAAKTIESDFTWSSTVQGYHYWETVTENLRKIVGEASTTCESCGQKLPE